MPTRTTPHTEKVREILSDLQPHSLDELVAQAGPLVPAGVAFRKTERQRLLKLNKSPEKRVRDDGSRVRGSRETAIRSGRRHIIYDSADVVIRPPRGKKWNVEGQVFFRLFPTAEDRVERIRNVLESDAPDDVCRERIEAILDAEFLDPEH